MSNRTEIRLGQVAFDTETLDLRDASGARIDLRAKSARVLAFLASRPDEIVGKAGILDAVWPDVTVSEESLPQCVSEIRKAIGDRDQSILRTHVGKGYSLAVAASGQANRVRKLAARGAAAVLLLGLAAAAYWWLAPPQRPPSELPRIAVLAFDDLSAGEDRGWLSDGIAEGILTELARYREFLVIARNSSFSFRDNPTDVTDIAAELNADYIVEGSKQKSGDRLRVTVQLIDGRDGTHMWTQDYDADIGELFDVQSEIVRSISAQIGSELRRRPAQTGGKAKVDALHFYLQGNQAFSDSTPESYRRAIDLYRQAIDADPEAPFGYSGMATIIWSDSFQGWIYADVPRDELLKRGAEYAEAAIAADPDYYAAQIARGDIHAAAGELEDAVDRYQRAVELNPSSSIALAVAADPLIYLDRADEAIALMERAIELNPVVPGWYYNNLSRAFFAVGRCAEGVETIKKRRRLKEWDYRALIVNLVCAGDLEEAHRAAGKLLQQNPDFTVSAHKQRTEKAMNFSEYHDRWIEALRAAGLPEG